MRAMAVIRSILSARERFVLLLFLCLSPFRSFGQIPVRVTTLNDLSLGTVTAGQTLIIRPSDASAAKFSLVSSQDTTAIIRFFLPTECSSLLGNDRLRVEFTSNGAAWSTQDAVSSATMFDPRQPLVLQLQPDRPVYVWIGIVAYPHTLQQAGRYATNITLTVVSLR